VGCLILSIGIIKDEGLRDDTNDTVTYRSKPLWYLVMLEDRARA
jgi:hypothetical protein